MHVYFMIMRSRSKYWLEIYTIKCETFHSLTSEMGTLCMRCIHCIWQSVIIILLIHKTFVNHSIHPNICIWTLECILIQNHFIHQDAVSIYSELYSQLDQIHPPWHHKQPKYNTVATLQTTVNVVTTDCLDSHVNHTYITHTSHPNHSKITPTSHSHHA